MGIMLKRIIAITVNAKTLSVLTRWESSRRNPAIEERVNNTEQDTWERATEQHR